MKQERTFYTEEEIKIIEKYYPEFGASGKKGCARRIKEQLGKIRTPKNVAMKANKLGIKRKYK